MSWQQPAGPVHPEVPEGDPSAASLADEQRRDQEAGDDEEDVDAEEASGQLTRR